MFFEAAKADSRNAPSLSDIQYSRLDGSYTVKPSIFEIKFELLRKVPWRALGFILLLSGIVLLAYDLRISSLLSGAHSDIDWSRFAYTQYVTNEAYLCNSVMMFESLHRLGAKADKVMLYPEYMPQNDLEAELLSKAELEYGVRLTPITVMHKDSGDGTWADSFTKLLNFNQTEYDRVLHLDSDGTVFQHMDELFLLPSAPVALPRAYWLHDGSLSDQLMLVEPSTKEIARLVKATEEAENNVFDMDIVDALYHDSAMIIPHRAYDMLTSELHLQDDEHVPYLGNNFEPWDADKAIAEAKFIHFSDWPVPKPWLKADQRIVEDHWPACAEVDGAQPDCHQRNLWLGFYADFRARRMQICGSEYFEHKERLH